MDNFHLIVVYFISLCIIGIEGEDWGNWYENYYPPPPQSPGAGNPAPQQAWQPAPQQAWQSAPQQAWQPAPQQAWQSAPQQAPPMPTYTAPPTYQKRPASPSGPSSAPKRLYTGAPSSCTSSSVNTIVVQKKLDGFFLDKKDRKVKKKTKVGSQKFGSLQVDLIKMNGGNPYSQQDLYNNFGIWSKGAKIIINACRETPNQISITAGDLAEFFRGERGKIHFF
ncbi:actin cytoskeleton-regulatory complex protein PAN1 isoform X2 [Nilaparvata lugens]|uniref:actin cytoskeleton-regulatory complex protein PAN1 isoform X2 n=1 Tax=Nilaparvata lugens TaxID=108931 RepID=UPI00193E049C|nr:actin cytoskeleton-regulatory complex protein PAN1 isoform X2 [Nilaparvata lugens]